MKTISLFSGCGGLDLGAKRGGAEILFANDIDPDSCETLKRYFPETEIIEGDISEIKAFPKADLVIGGYPCQSFSMAGKRNPSEDERSYLFLHFARCLEAVQPRYFLAENVDGLRKVQNGAFLDEQRKAFGRAGKYGYRITVQPLDAKHYGVPQTRKRIFLVGIRRDLNSMFVFPGPTHFKPNIKKPLIKSFTSHGEAIRNFPLWPKGEFYERPHDPEGHWSWYYMSRNRKAPWDGPSYTIVANWRHTPLHPASHKMKLTWSDLKNGWKQRWDFTNEYEHFRSNDPGRPVLKEPRRLSWRECAAIQTFPEGFEPTGKVESKFNQIGNAVPPLLAEILIKSLVSGKGLRPYQGKGEHMDAVQLAFWD